MSNHVENIVTLGLLAANLQQLSRQLLAQACILQAELERLNTTSKTLQDSLERSRIDDHVEPSTTLAPKGNKGPEARTFISSYWEI